MNLALVAILVSSFVASPPDDLAALRVERSDFRNRSYRLFIQGRKTDVVLESGNVKPDLVVQKTRDGVVYGTVFFDSSGAFTKVQSFAFLKSGKQIHTLKDMQVKQRQGETILFEPVQPGIWAEKGNAKLWQSGKLHDLGPATAVEFAGDGSVRGWYLAAEDGSQWEGLLSEALDVVYQQHFSWTIGKRTLTTREIRLDGRPEPKQPPDFGSH